MTNEEWLLVGRAKEGDAHAFAKLYERYYKDLYYFALSYMGEEAAAEDAVSAGVLKAYENLCMLKKTTAFKSWLFKIVANSCKNSLRERGKIIPVDFQAPDTPYKQEAEEADYVSAEWKEVLSALSDKERLVITLTVFSGYSSADAAKILGMRAGTVRSLKSRSIEKLRELI